MKRFSLCITVILVGSVLFPSVLFSQDEPQTATFRTLSVDWWAQSNVGVKIQYRGFDNTIHLLYLPKSFENKYYQFIRAPSNVTAHGLPALIIRIRDQEIIFIDIYTQHLRGSGRFADFTDKDLERFKTVEESGKVELVF